MVRLGLGPGLHRIAAVHAGRDAAELLLRLLQLTHRDPKEAVCPERQPLVRGKLLLEALAAKSEGAFAPGRELTLDVLDVLADRGRRFHRRVGQVSEQVQVTESAEGSRQILVDEALGPAKALEADFEVDAG